MMIGAFERLGAAMRRLRVFAVSESRRGAPVARKSLPCRAPVRKSPAGRKMIAFGARFMTNADVARVFNEIADLLEIKGESAFRVNSYRRVARSVGELAEDINEVAARGGLAAIPGVGKSSAEKIQELLDTGRVTVREQLAQEVPVSLLELLRIPGMGPKKAALLWKQRGVDSLDALQAAIDAGGLADLKGFGPKSIEKIRKGIEFLRSSGARTRVGVAWEIAERMRDAVAAMSGVTRVEHAGSLRRGCETVGDLDLLCIAADGPSVIERFTKLPDVKDVLAAGDTKGSVVVEYAPGRSIQVDLRVVPAESFGAAWQYFTGSKEHNVRLRERAVRRGWSLNEYALSQGERIVAAASEEEIYQALDLPWIPPELREDRGEFELTETPLDLVTAGDIRGELHMHTTASDGKFSIEEMACAARERGYEYICITDHTASSAIANGLDAERMREHIRAVRAADAVLDDITILVGAEVDIRADGSLDYDDDLLAQLDWVVASNHYHMSDDRDANTQRALAAIRNPYVNLLAHPTGRIINRREAMPIDIEAIAAAAADSGTALEINSNHLRLDLKDQHARLAAERGACISINCDAHHVSHFDQIRFGVATARRAWIRRAQVVNTWPLKKLRRFVAKKRSAAKH
ncbi:MAG: DNA polymerase/3'-5' exonuclease PolX [Planctomycetota bacterium]|nr:MAG: DNA polymerase/3'-5' exonuclease PolX [Planctomycetota bacterium]